MIEAVFISDLHLHPSEYAIEERFRLFLKWVVQVGAKELYILGDFFYAWAGDDTRTPWSDEIASQLHRLKETGIQVFYMQGNRDFLLGKEFALRAGWIELKEPTVIYLGQEKVMLVHGDRYCTHDIAHQRFRMLTRNRLFKTLFLSLSLKYRQRLVEQVRQRSQNNITKTVEVMDVVEDTVLHHMHSHQVNRLIHGHTHRPATHRYQFHDQEYVRYVLSDWDDTPKILCYDSTKGLYFTHIHTASGAENA